MPHGQPLSIVKNGLTRSVNTANQNVHVQVIGIVPNSTPWTDGNEDGAYADLVDYVDYPREGAPYDFILVDGRARTECLKRAFYWISDDGVVVLHDAVRKYYHEGLDRFTYQTIFDQVRGQAQGLWLGSKGNNLEKYLHVARHQRYWNLRSRRRM